MACHALVQRILLEAIGVVEVDPRTTAVATVMSPPAQLDMAPMFADDAIFAGISTEVARALRHIKTVMPSLGLRFSRLEVTPAAGERHMVDLQEFTELGCTVNLTKCVEIMKSPVGLASY
eukprot:1258353-Karenia_brevis.AAC.1